MKTLKSTFCGILFFALSFVSHAQSDTARAREKAYFFADSLVKSGLLEEWNHYAELVPASVIKFYGGKAGFLEQAKKVALRTVSATEEEYPSLTLLQMINDNEHWQCVIQESRFIHRDDKKWKVVTFLVGQSLDDGQQWKFFDVSYNSVTNVIYMMPDIFGNLAIPQPRLIPAEEALAREEVKPDPVPVKKKNKTRQ